MVWFEVATAGNKNHSIPDPISRVNRSDREMGRLSLVREGMLVRTVKYFSTGFHRHVQPAHMPDSTTPWDKKYAGTFHDV